jgi:hypothetical protein
MSHGSPSCDSEAPADANLILTDYTPSKLHFRSRNRT